MRDIALLKPNSKVWYIAPTYKQAKTIAWSMLQSMIPSEILRDKKLCRKNEVELLINFLFNGSEIALKGCDKEDSLRGSGLDFVVLDEYASMKKNVWTEIIRPALSDKKAPALFIGTPKGYNHFYELYMQGKAGSDKNYRSFQFPTADNPYIDPKEIEAAKNAPDMDEYTFRQEYLAEFVPIGSRPVFHRKNLIWYREQCSKPAKTGKLVHVSHIDIDGSERVTFVDDSLGNLSVWEEPQYKGQYIIGVDVAEGLEIGDNSSVHVLNKQTFKIAAIWHGKIDPSFLADELWLLGWWYNMAHIGVESNNHGIAVLRRLQRELFYPNIFYTEVMDEKTQMKTRKYGWYTNFKTKRILIDDLQRVIIEKSLELKDEKTIDELLSFSYGDSGEMEAVEGMHDDRVMSLAIANQLYKLRPFIPESNDVYVEYIPRNATTGY